MYVSADEHFFIVLHGSIFHTIKLIRKYYNKMIIIHFKEFDLIQSIYSQSNSKTSAIRLLSSSYRKRRQFLSKMEGIMRDITILRSISSHCLIYNKNSNDNNKFLFSYFYHRKVITNIIIKSKNNQISKNLQRNI